MFNPGIRSSDRTVWGPREKQASVPELDYAKLLSKLGMEPGVRDAIQDEAISPTEITIPQPTVTPDSSTPEPNSAQSSAPDKLPPTLPTSDSDKDSDEGPDDAGADLDADTTASVFVRDMRTAKYSVDDLTEQKGVEELDPGSIVPVPGLMINEEDDDGTEAPIVSDWIAPQGPFWNSYNQN